MADPLPTVFSVNCTLNGFQSNEDKDIIPPPPLHKASNSLSSHQHYHNNENSGITKSYSQYHPNHVTNVIVETPPPMFHSDYNSETGVGSAESTTSSSSGFNSGEGGVTIRLYVWSITHVFFHFLYFLSYLGI